jgi:SAM-dependent methyltransferase
VNLNLLRDLIAKARAESRTPHVFAAGDAQGRGHLPAGQMRLIDSMPYVERLRHGRIADDDFDHVYPLPARAVSSTFWTPIRVATRASELLVRDTSTRVLDVGSGAGKFCIVGAATTGAQFVGVEHRAHLVETARTAAACVGVTNARFIHGTFDTVDITSFDAVYLYNPFEENVWDRPSWIDETVELSRERFVADVKLAERLLAEARAGTRVVTYHGFGGDMPPGYRLARTERCHSGQLDLWIREEDPALRRRRSASERLCDPLAGTSPSTRFLRDEADVSAAGGRVPWRGAHELPEILRPRRCKRRGERCAPRLSRGQRARALSARASPPR